MGLPFTEMEKIMEEERLVCLLVWGMMRIGEIPPDRFKVMKLGQIIEE